MADDEHVDGLMAARPVVRGGFSLVAGTLLGGMVVLAPLLAVVFLFPISLVLLPIASFPGVVVGAIGGAYGNRRGTLLAMGALTVAYVAWNWTGPSGFQAMIVMYVLGQPPSGMHYGHAMLHWFHAIVIPLNLAVGVVTGELFRWIRTGWPRADRGLCCQTCDYDLRGNVSGRCPECGTPVPEAKGVSNADGMVSTAREFGEDVWAAADPRSQAAVERRARGAALVAGWLLTAAGVVLLLLALLMLPPLEHVWPLSGALLGLVAGGLGAYFHRRAVTLGSIGVMLVVHVMIHFEGMFTDFYHFALIPLIPGIALLVGELLMRRRGGQWAAEG